jgi:hypothetical protein
MPFADTVVRVGKPFLRAAVLAAVWGAALPAHADCVTPTAPGRVTLDCRAVPLSHVLRGLAGVVHIDSKLIDASALASPIYVGVTDVPAGQALQAALDAAGVSFVLFGNDGAELKVFASGGRGAGTGAATRTASVRSATGSASSDPSEFIPDEVPEVEEVPEVKEVAAPAVQPSKADLAAATGSASGFNPNVPGSPGSPAMTDPLRMTPEPSKQGPQTMEEILARSNPAGAGAAPQEKQVFQTMEEILARTGQPKQPQ